MGIRRFHWDVVDDCVMHETDGAGNTLVAYTHEPGQFGPLLSENRGGTESNHHYDALGSTTMLTNDAGTVTDTFTYDAWGNEVARTGLTPTPYTWVGRWGYQNDSATTGGYYIRARSYQPMVARWMSIDPLWITYESGMYIYADSRPVHVVDISGLAWVLIDPIISPYIYTSTAAGDTLQQLASRVSGDENDWACIWPRGGDDKWANSATNVRTYPATGKPCAEADATNLTANLGPVRGGKIELSKKPSDNRPLSHDDRLMIALKQVLQSKYFTTGNDAGKQIALHASFGKNPLSRLVIGGHCAPPHFPCIGGFNARSLLNAWRDKLPGSGFNDNKYDLAKAKSGPPRCWFERNADVYGYGCSTARWAATFQANVGRTLSMHSTNNTVWGHIAPAWVTLIDDPAPSLDDRYSNLTRLLQAWH